MANMKVSPAELAELAKIKAAVGKTVKPSKVVPKDAPPPSPSTTVPDITDPNYWLNLPTVTTPTTTIPSVTTVPISTTPTTVAPPVTTPKTEEERLSVVLDRRIAEGEAGLLGKYKEQEIARIKAGKKKPSQPFWKQAVGFAINNPLTEATVLKPLKTLAWVGRAGVSAFEESAQYAREHFPGGAGIDRYEPGDYIPKHKQTGKPIAGPGDPVIRNWEEIINTPVSDKDLEKINSATTAKEQAKYLNEATYNVVKDKARTSSGSAKEFFRQWGSPTEFSDYGFGGIEEVQVGRHLAESGKVSPTVGKWIDRVTGFGGDVALDPATYLSMGTTTAAATGIKNLGEVAGKELVSNLADNIIEVGVKQSIKDAAPVVADILGEKVGSMTTQRTARAAVAEAAKVAEQRVLASGAEEAVRKEAANIVKDAARKWSAIAPRREIGAGARQATANEISLLRDEAQKVIDEFAPYAASGIADSAEVRAAKAFVDTITDDVIKDVAVRGNAAITGPVAEVLSTPGGLRWGIGKYKLSIPGSEYLTRPIGKGFTLPRKALAATEVGRKIIGATTRIGEGGLFGSEYIYNWRTGLRSGFNAETGAKLTGKEAVDALKRLAEDQTYRALKKTTSQTVKQAVDSIFRTKEFRPYFRTVHELLTNPAIDENVWKKTAQEIAVIVGRPIEEVRLALRIRDIRNEFGDILTQLSTSLGGDAIKFPENWFPEALNDKTLIWLSKDTPLVRDTLKALGLDTAPLAGHSLASPLEEGITFFGRRLTADDIAGGISRFNEIARAGGFKGEFFDTHAGSAVEKWARKFADDYAFLRNAVRGDLEALGGGAKSFPTTLFTGGMVNDLAETEWGQVIYDVLNGEYSNISDAKVLDFAEKLKLAPADVVDIANQLKHELTDGAEYYEWFFNDDGTFSIPNIMERFNYLIVEKRVKDWNEELLREAQLAVTGKRTQILRTPQTVRNKNILDDQEYILSTVSNILDVINDEMILGGKSGNPLWTALTDEVGNELDGYRVLFAQTPEKFIDFIDNIDPRVLDTVVNMTEDAFVKLNNQLIPDVYAKSEIAKFYSNFRRLKEPKFQNGVVRYIRNYNRFIKTWVTNTPGFHSRNLLANVWQMVAGGAETKNLSEGLMLLKDWNQFVKTDVKTIANIESTVRSIIDLPLDATVDNPEVKKIAKELNVYADDVLFYRDMIDTDITRFGAPKDDWRYLADRAGIKTRLQDPELMVDRFLTDGPGKKYTPLQQQQFRETMMWTGAAGFGDVEEVFGAAIPSRLGITGAEVPVREGVIGKVRSKVSEEIGRIPRKSRSIGGTIENYSRFMFTYDGIRQGLTPEQAAARTARYLVDYEDLTKLDAVAKLIFPFWTWMSRNLPVQTANMFMNPKSYAIYNHFRKNFEDKNGNNALLPDYLREAGIWKAPFGKNIYVKPDIGFPGAGSPSPLQEGVTDWRSLLTAIPGYSLGSAITGTQAYSGAPLKGAGQVLPEVARQLLPPVGVAGRYIGAVPGIGAGTDWGALGPLQDILGIKGPRESGAGAQTTRAASSLFGIPLTNIGPDQENMARREILDRLQPFIDQINRERYGK